MELSRRLASWESQTPAGFPSSFIRAIHSPGDTRGVAKWKINEIIAGCTGSWDLIAIFLSSGSVHDTTINPDNNPLATLVGGQTGFGGGGGKTSPGVTSDILAVSTAGVPIVEMDFHPLEVNPTDNLGIYFHITTNVTVRTFGYSIGYTLITQR